MKKSMKLLALLLSIMMVMSVTLTGCGNAEKADAETDKETAQETSDSGETEAEAETEVETEELEFVELTFLMMGNVPTNGQLELAMDEWNKILEKEINAHLSIEWVEWADWLTKYNLLMASGEPIDLITSGDWLDMWPNAQKGAFMPLDDLLQYAPKTIGEMTEQELKTGQLDGVTYFVPENNYTQYVNHGVFYRGDWAKEFGIDAVTDYETLGKYLQGVKDNYPDIVPWDVNGTKYDVYDGWIISETDALELLMVPTGFHKAVWAESKDAKYSAFSPIFEDTFMEFAKEMQVWGDAGYWREDVLNFKGDTRELFKAGQTGADQHHTQTFRGLRYEMDELIPGSEIGFYPFGSTRQNLTQLSVIHGATAIGANSENPERAMMALEVIRQNEEFYHLFNYGREGVQYVIEDGVRTRPDGYDDAEHGFYTDFWSGREDKFELPTDTEYAGIYDLWAEFDSYAIPDPYARFIFDRTPVEAELAAISDVTSALGPAITFGKTGDPEAAVIEYREKLKKAGIDKVLEEVQKQLDAYEEMMNN